ncbi:MAG: Eco57I restriction-modification methylase domain-containing protein [Myxococcales bacterium]|jgi:SAM-dependent methyltransferase|nr:Eco57I restriction-modification methylase domain-containing protein [Myxococcales bacterium]
MSSQLAMDFARSRALADALSRLSSESSIEERGAVFTRSEVVEGILDLCGYTSDRDLTTLRLLEPSCGDGEFLLPSVRRLVASARRQGILPSQWPIALVDAIVAVELHAASVERARDRVGTFLTEEGMPPDQAATLCARWVRCDDFLLADMPANVDVAVGNPPYVRQERIPDLLLTEYRRRFATLYDRADLYVLFYERCLRLLAPGGLLGFICANRWIKNKYGGPLRELIARSFNLETYIDLQHADAFHSTVDAYPAITLIRRAQPGQTAVITSGRNGKFPLSRVFAAALQPKASNEVTFIERVASGRDPWLLDAPAMLQCIRSLESRLPTLEESGARIGIGVATGSDHIYIGDFEKLPVEPARKLRLAMSEDLTNSGVRWSGRGLVNPWTESGTLASLDDYPRFGAYMKRHEATLRARHTAKNRPVGWFRTIDRVWPDLTRRPKLLIPDIKGEAVVSYDEGAFYPHHNLYVVTSETWDLRVLQTLLRSSVALAIVAAYCVRMSGGFLRFQAQYLRRIRVPRPESLSADLRRRLRSAATSTDQEEIDRVAIEAYGFTQDEAVRICDFAAAARVPKGNA